MFVLWTLGAFLIVVRNLPRPKPQELVTTCWSRRRRSCRGSRSPVSFSFRTCLPRSARRRLLLPRNPTRYLWSFVRYCAEVLENTSFCMFCSFRKLFFFSLDEKVLLLLAHGYLSVCSCFIISGYFIISLKCGRNCTFHAVLCVRHSTSNNYNISSSISCCCAFTASIRTAVSFG